MNCVLCKASMAPEDKGNNALPLKKGLCCDMCNASVILARLKLAGANK